MIAKPYVGVTGFKSEEEISGLARVFSENGFAEDRSPYSAMFGIIVSNNRLADLESRGNKSPPAKDLANICRVVPGMGNSHASLFYK